VAIRYIVQHFSDVYKVVGLQCSSGDLCIRLCSVQGGSYPGAAPVYIVWSINFQSYARSERN